MGLKALKPLAVFVTGWYYNDLQIFHLHRTLNRHEFFPFYSNRAARSKYTLFGLAVGIYDVYTFQTSGIHGARERTLCIRNLCTNVKTDHQGEGIAQSRVLFLDKRSIKGLCIW